MTSPRLAPSLAHRARARVRRSSVRRDVDAAHRPPSRPQTPGHGPEPAQRRAARALVPLARHGAPPDAAGAQQRRAPRSRRSSSTKARSKACAATSRSCSRSLETGWFGYPARRSRPTFEQLRAASTRTTAAQGCTNCRGRRLAAEPRASRRRRSACARRSSCCAATPTRIATTSPDRLRIPPVRPRRARADLGVLRRQQLPVRQAHLGAARRLRHPHHPAVLAARSCSTA